MTRTNFICEQRGSSKGNMCYVMSQGSKSRSYYYFSISDFKEVGFPDFDFPDFDLPDFDILDLDFPDFDYPNFYFPGYYFLSFDFPGFDILDFYFPDLEYQGSPRETRGNIEGSNCGVIICHIRGIYGNLMLSAHLSHQFFLSASSSEDL